MIDLGTGITLAGIAAVLAFLWKLTKDISGVELRLSEKITAVDRRVSSLAERVAHIEELLEGARTKASNTDPIRKSPETIPCQS